LNVSVLFEIVAGLSECKNASPDFAGITMKQIIAAQNKTTSKARGLIRAELEMDFFCIAVGKIGAPLVFDMRRTVNIFNVFSDFFWIAEKRYEDASHSESTFARNLQRQCVLFRASFGMSMCLRVAFAVDRLAPVEDSQG